MLIRFIIGFALGTICAFCASGCGNSISDYGNHPPIEWVGKPVDTQQAEAVYTYITTVGAEALGKHDHQDYLGNVRYVNFVPSIFTCDHALYGDQQCFGITEDDPASGDAHSTVALVVADYTEAPTGNVGCTALGHELAHTLSWNITGDSDDMHTNPAIWGPDGFVVKGLEQFCPEWNYTPNNLNPTTN